MYLGKHKKRRKVRKYPKTSYPVTRTKIKEFRHTSSYWLINGSAGPGVCQTPVTGRLVTPAKAVDSVTLGASPPGWRDSLKSGEQGGSVLRGLRTGHFVHQAVYQFWRDKASFPSDDQCFQGYAEGVMNGIPAFPGVLQVINADADLKARQNFLGDALKARKSWRGGNFLAEVVETIHMLKHPIEGLAKSVGGLARDVKGIRNLGGGTNYAKALGDIWLTRSFGWSPLFEDIKDANTALRELDKGGRFDLQRVIGSSTILLDTLHGQTIIASGMPNYAQADTWRKTQSSVKYYGALKARPECFAQVADSFGFSAGDIVPAVWEAVPWSFFIDYFLNVQEQLDSMQFARSEFGYIMRGIRNLSCNYRSDWYPTSNAASSGHVHVRATGGQAASSTTYVQRDPQTAIPFPPFHFRIPGLGSLKWVNVGALAGQIFGSRPRANG